MFFKTTLFYDIKKYFYKPVGGNRFLVLPNAVLIITITCGPEKKLTGAETISIQDLKENEIGKCQKVF